MSETQEFWEGKFGDAYHKRNRVDWRQRVTFWSEILELTGARSVWEWGCGPGWNLTAIQYASSNYPVQVYGTECNESAIVQAIVAGLDVASNMFLHKADLTMTVGALIHVDPDSVQDLMQKIIDTSSDYVLAVEYESEKPREILYRGHKGKLWALPFAKYYEGMGLEKVWQGDPGEAFDRCTATLFRK